MSMYDHKKTEQEIATFWREKNIYEKVKKNNAKGSPFYFCDGPPYATGSIHPGTGWNKTIKDAVCRYHRFRGRNVRAQPGYDTHGLPIEVKVEQEMKLKNKNEIEKIGIGKFVAACKEFATKYISVMNGQFSSLGVWMDFENPYITYKDDYIEKSWKTLKKAWDQKLMHEGLYVLPYCYRCETTMANYELEYGDETDPSVYVKFKVISKNDKNEYLIIWTTTPWTLPLNLFVMVHPTFPYVRVKVGSETWIIAKDRLSHLQEITQESFTVLEEVSGKKLDGLRYLHPFQDKLYKKYDRRVVLSDEAVTTEEGTGLVHGSTGTGPIDFVIGKRYDIECYSPIDSQGKYTNEVGDIFTGKNVKAANLEIIDLMKENGTLIHEVRIRHRYPHCWRCKTPLIFRAIKQWFITISKTKDQMLKEIEKVEWHPAFVKERFREFVSSAPDWCISRQRYWGIPLPIWRCISCSEIRVIDSRKELPTVKELHRPYVDEIILTCTCKNDMKRVPDVLDVWFDSGNAIWASLSDAEAKEFGERADIIIEGQDQIRGWFYSLLGSGIVKFGQSPYKRLLMHGFFVDQKGEKMSKSLGNFVPLEEILEKYGADSFRLWGLTNTVSEELKFNWEEMKKAQGDLNILFNLVVFLQRFYPAKKITKAKLSHEDLWLISRIHSTLKEFRDAFETYELHRAVKVIRNFIVEDVSRLYMKLAKDRISSDEERSAALFTIYTALLTALKMVAVFSPFISEELYQVFFKKYEKDDSIFLLSIEDEETTAINISVENQMALVKEICTAALNARQEAKLKVRFPVRTLFIETKSHEIKNAVTTFSDAIIRLVNVKEVSVVASLPHKEHYATQAIQNGGVYLSKQFDEELYQEGISNEVKRRIQILRKEANFVEKDTIVVFIDGEKELLAIIEKSKERLLKEVNAKDIKIEMIKDAKEFEIDGRVLRINIKK